MLTAQLTTVAAALFTGAAIYINVAEQPARQALAAGPMLVQWQASYRRAAVMQASLALIGGVLGGWAAYDLADGRWVLAALLLIANWPYTLLCIMPTNDALHRLPISEAGPDARRLVATWGRLHAGRSALGLAAVLACLWAGH
jgi:NAD-dependent oxidoreductase involved in siderophore biosynthesis